MRECCQRQGVSTHAPAWGATLVTANKRFKILVSTHAPAWGATRIVRKGGLDEVFQPTRPHGARQKLQVKPFKILSFNPRARMGRDVQYDDRHLCLVRVSTHAPAWGATHTHDPIFSFYVVSTHAPAWGATRIRIMARTASLMFQPTRPHGARPRPMAILAKIEYVSTHAPAWGATSTLLHEMVHSTGFNPRARMGRDLAQLTSISQPSSFNPRARMGRDIRKTRLLPPLTVSTHAPAWGATTTRANLPPSMRCFNPRARMGRDSHCM